jgi:anti-anti-sigma regulatory factor
MAELTRLQLSEAAGISVAGLHGEIDLTNAKNLRDRIFTTIANTTGGFVLEPSNVAYRDSGGV